MRKKDFELVQVGYIILIKNKIKIFLIIWLLVFLTNQIALYGACFALQCILSAVPHTLVISIVLYLIFYYVTKDTETTIQEENKDNSRETKNPTLNKEYTQPHRRAKSINQKKGDAYEKYIGGKFEEKGDIVIYNGFIKGYEDKGIDVIALSKQSKTINLVQCKNWTRKPMSLNDVKNIYHKLNVHYDNLDLYYLPISEIYKHMQHENLDFLEFDDTLHDLRTNIDIYNIRKTLYIASDKVIDLEIGKHLIMMQANIYRYKDMKIVIETM